ncbi:MAG TPA: hypothetical protein VNV43_12530 [Candidatus Acidoferrales bacterium]|nr:hypothetical protein [Candidatus Acidoferrales bacterium]
MNASTPAKHAFIPDLFETHFEELAFLWSQRRSALVSRRYSRNAFRDLEERVEAHVAGLLHSGEHIVPATKDGLSADDAAVAFASAYTLLRLKSPTTAYIVMEVFREAQEEQLDGIRQALCHGPIELVLEDLRQAAATASPTIAVAAIEALHFHSKLGPEAKHLEQFLSDENPEVREAAWRINGRIGFVQSQTQFEVALADNDLRVRRETLFSAGWTQQRWLPGYCRLLAANPTKENEDALMLLAILGKPNDLQCIQDLGRVTMLGPKRFQILGAFGHPGVIDGLIRELGNSDLRSAVAAGAAFTKITGCDVESDKRVQLPPEDGHEPDEFEKEFLDEAKLSDAQRALAHWQKVKDSFAKGTRWCRGFDLSQLAKPEVLNQLDMESRWGACLRGKFEGTWQGNPMDLERFPQ